MMHPFYYIQSVHLRHSQVCEDKIVFISLDQPERFAAALDGVDCITGRDQYLPETVEHDRFVIHRQDACKGLGHIDALERFGLMGEIQAQSDIQRLESFLLRFCFTHPFGYKPDQHIYNDESRDH